MPDPYLGEIRPFPFNFAPNGWALCQGQVLEIKTNTALYAVIGTQYGGDGINNFALPNLTGAVPIGAGTGTGLSSYNVGQTDGATTVALQSGMLPGHTHAEFAIAGPAAASTLGAGMSTAEGQGGTGRGSYQVRTYAPPGSGSATTLIQSSVGSTGGGQPHNNLQPSLVINWCIALNGIFPPRT